MNEYCLLVICEFPMYSPVSMKSRKVLFVVICFRSPDYGYSSEGTS